MMKTKVVLLSVLLYPLLGLSAQTESYLSYFGNEYAEWYIYLENIDISLSMELKTSKEETIMDNEKSYYTIWAWEDYMHPFAGIREDLLKGALYLNIDGRNEILVSQMDLKIGDKYYIPKQAYLEFFEGLKEDEQGYYTEVKDIYYKDERKHIVLEAMCIPPLYKRTPDKYYPLIFIEGVGPNCSFAPFLNEESFYLQDIHSLICYETDEASWKLNDFWDNWSEHLPKDCLFNLVSIPEVNNVCWEVCQEESSLKITFDTPSANGNLRLYSIDGKLYFSTKTNGDSVIEIPTASLPSGSYLLHYADSTQGALKNAKILIKN